MAPCIKCLVVNPLNGESRVCLAMLDSGAYPNGIGEGLAQSLGLATIGTDTLHAALSVAVSSIYSANLVMEGVPGEIALSFHSSNHHANGHPYEIILGRQFLTNFDFGFDRTRQEWHLSLPDN